MTDSSAPGLDGPPLAIVLAADERFAMPLAVTMRSVLDSAAVARSVRFLVLDGGLSEGARERIAQSCRSPRLAGIEWVPLSDARLEGLRVSGHVNRMTYARLLIPELLDRSIERVIYLDSDLLVRRDLGPIWDGSLEGALCRAAQDCAAPFLDSAKVLSNFRRCAPYMVARRPVPNAAALGLPPEQPYLNGGVLVLDPGAWRREGLTQRMLRCLEENVRHIRWWDQYALNVVLAGRWTSLDPRWNQGAHLYTYPTWRESPYDQGTFESLRDDPHIVHFASPVKPWHAESRHPFRDEWLRCLDRTKWAGWRPPPGRPEQRLWKACYWTGREVVRRTLRRTQLLLSESLVK